MCDREAGRAASLNGTIMGGEDRLRERLTRSSLFEPEEYHRLNPDLRGLDYLQHFLSYGAWEPHRAFAERREFARLLGAAAAELKSAGEAAPAPPVSAAGLDVGVYVSSQGRFFVEDIARMLAAELTALGARAQLLDETADPGTGPSTRIFVAPHEFFRLGRGAAWPRSEVLASSYVFNLDQITSSGFRALYPYALVSKGVIDLHPHGGLLWRDAGLPWMSYAPRPQPAGAATFDHPLYSALPRAARSGSLDTGWSDRPLDIAFFGSESAARDEVFARHAAFFAERPCFIHCTRSLGTPLSDTYGGQRTALTRHIARQAKVWLNVHRAEVGSVHWPRVVMFAMASGALAVSTPCAPHPDYQAGVHYFEESARRLPQLIRWLLDTPDGQDAAEAVRAEAAKAVQRASNAPALARFLLNGAEA